MGDRSPHERRGRALLRAVSDPSPGSLPGRASVVDGPPSGEERQAGALVVEIRRRELALAGSGRLHYDELRLVDQ